MIAMPFRRRKPDGSGQDFLSYLWICPHKPTRSKGKRAEGVGKVGKDEDEEDADAMLRSESCLLVAGIPPDVPLEQARRTVARLMRFGGKIDRVVMNTGGASCVVVFEKKSSVSVVIDRAVRGEPPEGIFYPDASWGAQTPVGMDRWVAQYRAGRRSLDDQQARADAIANDIQRRQQERAERLDREAEAAADDGWTVVMHRKDKKKKVRDAGGTVSRGVRASTAATMALLDKQRQKAEKEKQESGLDDFYRFQKRENRKKGTHLRRPRCLMWVFLCFRVLCITTLLFTRRPICVNVLDMTYQCLSFY